MSSPVTVNGWLGALEDVDVFRVQARAGEDLGGEDHRGANRIERRHRGDVPQASTATTLASNDDFGATRDSLVVYRPTADTDVLVRVADANPSGGRHHYRLTLGVVPVVTSAFPLGRRGPVQRRRRLKA